jgi:hypothetical protein
VALVIAAVLIASYLSELPRYRFEQVAAEVGHRLPETRPISAIKAGHLASPVSWFWPAKTVWTFASPDVAVSDRFYIITLMYEEDHPTTRLVDVDCNNRKMIWYDLEEPDTAFPARDLWGQPVLAPNGKTYRRVRIQPQARPEWMQAFCETDWSTEMKVLMRTRDDKCNDVARHQVISVQQTYPVEVDVEIKLSTWPEVTMKYSGTLAGMNVATLFAVTTAVEPMVAHSASVDAIRTW